MKSEKEIKSIYDNSFHYIYEKNFDNFFDSVFKTEKECRNQSQYQTFKDEINYFNLYLLCKEMALEKVYEIVRNDFINYKNNNEMFVKNEYNKKKIYVF